MCLAVTHDASQGSQHLCQYFPARYTLVRSPWCRDTVPIITDPSLTLDHPNKTFTTCTTTPHEVYATASRKPWHRHKSELKKKLNLRGGKRVPRRNKTRMWGLTPVRSFLFLHFLGLTFSKPPPPTVRLVHQHAGSILLTLRVIAVRTHRRQHQNTALQLLLYHHPQLVM